MRIIAALLIFALSLSLAIAQIGPLNQTEMPTNETNQAVNQTYPELTAEDAKVWENLSQPKASDAAAILDAKKAALSLAATNHLIQMDSAIEVAKEKSLNYSELTPIRDEFKKQMDTIGNAQDRASLFATEDLLQNLAKQFLIKAKEIGLKAYGSRLKDKISQLKENRANESEYYSEQAIEARKIAILRAFDHHVDIVNNAINKSESRNVSVTEVKAALDEFIALKPELVSAINSMNKANIAAVNKKVKEAWKNIRDKFISANLGDKIQRSMDRGNSIANIADSDIRKLKTQRVQTGAIESRLAEFKKRLQETQEAASSGDYVSAQDALRAAKIALSELKTTNDQAIGEVK